MTNLREKHLHKYRKDVSKIKYLIIDEYSIVEQRMLGWISRRCKQGTCKLTAQFSGLSVTNIGDIGHSPPVSDKVLYH